MFADAVQLHQKGRIADAIRLYEKVVRKAPGNAVALNLLGLARFQAGRPEDAVRPIEQALKVKPDLPNAHFNLGTILHALARYDEAARHLEIAVAARPDDAEARNSLAACLKALGRHGEAIEHYRKALVLRPGYAEAHFNLANALRTINRNDEAVAHYRRATELRPNFTAAMSSLADALFENGRPEEAILLVRGLLAQGNTRELRALFVRCISAAPSVADPAAFRQLVTQALTERWGRPDDMIVFAAKVLKANSAVQAVLENLADGRQRPRRAGAASQRSYVPLLADHLLRLMLQSAPLRDIALEQVLRTIRSDLIRRARSETADTASEDEIAFFAALAGQCFINGYIYGCADDEMELALRLQSDLDSLLATDAQIPLLWPLAVAMYFPLFALAHASGFEGRAWSEAVGAVIRQQVTEPERERTYRATMPRITAIDEATVAVQQQYEEMPSPLWVHVAAHVEAEPLHADLRRTFPRVEIGEIGDAGSVDVLIAGCGTGRESIEMAQAYSGLRILAVDISLASLGYARRKTEELGLSNIEYACADVLRVGSIGRQFDVISAGGTLQCLPNPLAGWSVLLSLLRPGGVMRVGIYSEIGRRRIREAQAYFSGRPSADTVQEIRRRREEILSNKNDPRFTGLVTASDFFALGQLRDLLFHVSETALTIPQIHGFVSANGLEFLGFMIKPQVLADYARRFPGDVAMRDLDQWHVFETENPNTFAGSYWFWVRKPDRS